MLGLGFSRRAERATGEAGQAGLEEVNFQLRAMSTSIYLFNTCHTYHRYEFITLGLATGQHPRNYHG